MHIQQALPVWAYRHSLDGHTLLQSSRTRVLCNLLSVRWDDCDQNCPRCKGTHSIKCKEGTVVHAKINKIVVPFAIHWGNQQDKGHKYIVSELHILCKGLGHSVMKMASRFSMIIS